MVDSLESERPAAVGHVGRLRAAVALSGDTMLYAEVEDRPGGGRRLNRLGACDFPFDAEQAVYRDGDPSSLSAISEALSAAFEGSEADAVILATSPMNTTTFFSLLPVDLSTEERDAYLRQEAALLADVPPTHPVRIRISAVGQEAFEDEPHSWYHVLHVEEAIHARISLMAQTLHAKRYDLIDSTRAALATATAVRTDSATSVLVGCMADHTEVVIVAPNHVLFTSHGAGSTPEDTAYFTLSALQRVSVESADVSQLLFYGTDINPERLSPLQQLIPARSELLDAFASFDRRPAGMSDEDLAAFVPVLGAALV